MKTKDLAALLGYHQGSIQRLIRTGQINAARIGKGRWRITQEEVARVLAGDDKPPRVT